MIIGGEDEVDFFKANAHKSNQEIAQILGRGVNAVSLKRIKLGLVKLDNDWSESELHFLSQHYHKFSSKFISQKIGRSVSAILTKANDMGLSKKNTFWDKKETLILQNNMDKTFEELVNLIPNKTKDQIAYKKTHLKYYGTILVDNKKKSGITKEVKLSAFSKKISYIEMLNSLQIGESFEFPENENSYVVNSKKELPHKTFTSKKVNDTTRRIWRLE